MRSLPIFIAIVIMLSGCAGVKSVESDLANLHKGEAVATSVITEAQPYIVKAKKHLAAVKAKVAEVKTVIADVKKDVGNVAAKIMPQDDGWPWWIDWLFASVGLAVLIALYRKYSRKCP